MPAPDMAGLHWWPWRRHTEAPDPTVSELQRAARLLGLELELKMVPDWVVEARARCPLGTTCACDPEPDLVVWLREQIDSERRQRGLKVDLMNGGLAEHDGAIRAYQLVIERLATRTMVITSVVEGRPSRVVEGEDY